ncbi:MAG: hypothetical protein WBE26_14115 [Phycisphaerae bacterium]
MIPPRQSSFSSVCLRLLLRAFCCYVIYLLLMVPWPGLMDGYRACFRAGANLLFEHSSTAGSVSFKPSSSIDDMKDTTLVLVKRKPVLMRGRRITPRGEMDISSIKTGYRPTAFLIALVLVTPIPWSRRWRALLFGLVLVNVFVAFRLALRILDAFSDPTVLALFSLGPFWKDMLRKVIKVLIVAPAGWYAVPAFIWLAVTFRRGDLANLFVPPQPSTGTTSTTRHR